MNCMSRRIIGRPSMSQDRGMTLEQIPQRIETLHEQALLAKETIRRL